MRVTHVMPMIGERKSTPSCSMSSVALGLFLAIFMGELLRQHHYQLLFMGFPFGAALRSDTSFQQNKTRSGSSLDPVNVVSFCFEYGRLLVL